MTNTIDIRCACVILAAGASRRLGRPKQLLLVKDESLIRRSARLALENNCSPVCVVLGSNAETIRTELQDCKVLLFENPDWQQGMSSSLRAGIHQVLKAQPDLQRLLLLVCDQPGLSSELLQRLHALAADHPQRIIASTYSGRQGVPAIFPVAYFPSLLSIEGDKGARAVIEEHRDQVVSLDFPEGALDIDTPQDARRAGLMD